MSVIKTPNGYIVASEIETFHVIDSYGWRDHGQVTVVLKSGRCIVTDMYEHDFLKAYKAALEAQEVRS